MKLAIRVNVLVLLLLAMHLIYGHFFAPKVSSSDVPSPEAQSAVSAALDPTTTNAQNNTANYQNFQQIYDLLWLLAKVSRSGIILDNLKYTLDKKTCVYTIKATNTDVVADYIDALSDNISKSMHIVNIAIKKTTTESRQNTGMPMMQSWLMSETNIAQNNITTAKPNEKYDYEANITFSID